METKKRFQFRKLIGSPTSCALAMLATVTAMAVFTVASRRSVPLGPRITPSSWTMGFQPPAGWDRHIRGTSGRAVEFVEPAREGRERSLFVGVIPNPGNKSAAEIASEKRREWGFGILDLIRGRRPAPHIEAAPFGPLRGVLLRDDERGMVIAVGLDRRDAFCVGLLNTQVPLNAADIELVRSVVGSFEPAR